MNRKLARPSLATWTSSLLLSCALAACGGGGDDGGGSTSPGGGTATVNLQTLSGMVRTSGGDPLANVTVTAGAAMGLTDARGAFILTGLGSLPVGNVLVEFDGATATPPGGGTIPYPLLDVMVPLPAGTTALTMPQVITLPDLNNPESANQTVMLNMDGTTAEPIAAEQTGGMMEIALTGPTGTLVTLGGAVGAANVDINVTPVASNEVPMPLPAGLLGNGFVTIQPGNGAFDPPDPAPPAAPIEGLDIVLPNTLGLAVGTPVDIWSFDHDDAAWVNRTAQTGQSGMVELIGAGPDTRIVASGVITEGGWHTGSIPVDPTCGTMVTGRVVDGAGNGIPGATVAFESGQFTMTDADGNFVSDLIPAYDVPGLAAGGPCTPEDVCFEVVLPPSLGGGSSGKVTIDSGDVVNGGTTDSGSTTFMLPSTGSVAGVVIGMGAAGEMVTLTPTVGAPLSVAPNANGSFFATGLEAGDWTASYTFLGEPMPTSVPFVITAGQITTIVIQMAKGGGDEDVTVLVIEDDDLDSTAPVPSAGATVRLRGTDPGSSGGLIMVTDANGMAVFQDVSGPFTVTAQKDVLAGTDTYRFAASVVEIEPASGTIGVLLGVDAPDSPVVLDATVGGTVANLPMLGVTEILDVEIREGATEGSGFNTIAFVDPTTGAYSAQVPSGVDLDLVVRRRDLLTNAVAGTLIVVGAGQAPQGGSLDVDLDYANAVAWDVPVDVNFANVPAGASVDVDVTLENIATGTRFDFALYMNPTVPGTVTLSFPDVTDPAFAPFRFLADANSFEPAILASQECQLLLTSTPASLTFDMIGRPMPTSPLNGDTLTVADLEALAVSFVQGANGSLGANGGNGFNMFYPPGGSGTPPAGVDAAFWTIFARSDKSGFDMPLAGLPMFGPGQDVFFQVTQFRFAGVPFQFDDFFSEDLAANFTALLTTNTAECQSSAGGQIMTQ